VRSLPLDLGRDGEFLSALLAELVCAVDRLVELHAAQQPLKESNGLHARDPFRANGEFWFERDIAQVLLKNEGKRLKGA
jgi:hypothetical protein